MSGWLSSFGSNCGCYVVCRMGSGYVHFIGWTQCELSDNISVAFLCVVVLDWWYLLHEILLTRLCLNFDWLYDVLNTLTCISTRPTVGHDICRTASIVNLWSHGALNAVSCKYFPVILMDQHNYIQLFFRCGLLSLPPSQWLTLMWNGMPIVVVLICISIPPHPQI